MKPAAKGGNGVILYCDGASRGNPGPSSYGYVVVSFEGEVLAKGCARIGITTNNVAEYQALVHGLKRCLDLGAREITIRSDSELMVRQLNGQYKVRAEQLKDLFKAAKTMLARFTKTHVAHVRREQNTVADALANEALDRA